MVLNGILQVVIGLFVLGILVLIHELGHFMVAKLFGVRVLSFSIGFGKPLVRRRLGDTEYRISAIPFGGFVHMAGEHPDDAHENKPWEFQAKPIWQRALIAIAGPAANYVSSIAFLWLVLVLGNQTPTYLMTTRIGDVADSSAARVSGVQTGDSLVAVNGKRVSVWDDVENAFARLETNYGIAVVRNNQLVELRLDSMLVNDRGIPRFPAAGMMPAPPPIVGKVNPGSPAQAAGLLPGDSIVTIDSSAVRTWMQVSRRIVAYDTASGPVRLCVVREGATVELHVTPYYDSLAKRFRIGMLAGEGATKLVKMGPIAAIPKAFERSNDIVVLIFNTLGQLFTSRVSPKELAGPVGIVQMSGGVALMGLSAILKFMALIGINLALLNLLPLVITDGGLLFFMLIEAVRGKPLPLKAQMIINQAAIAFFILLFVFVTFNDILRIPQLLHLGR